MGPNLMGHPHTMEIPVMIDPEDPPHAQGARRMEEREQTRAVDGGRLPPPAANIADTIRLLGDGQFDADVSAEARALIRKMEEHGHHNKGLSKGKIVITLDIKLSNGAHVIKPSFKVVAPVQEQPGTLLFALDDGRLSRNPQGQGQMFGVRDVTDARETRSV